MSFWEKEDKRYPPVGVWEGRGEESKRLDEEVKSRRERSERRLLTSQGKNMDTFSI